MFIGLEVKQQSVKRSRHENVASKPMRRHLMLYLKFTAKVLSSNTIRDASLHEFAELLEKYRHSLGIPLSGYSLASGRSISIGVPFRNKLALKSTIAPSLNLAQLLVAQNNKNSLFFT